MKVHWTLRCILMALLTFGSQAAGADTLELDYASTQLVREYDRGLSIKIRGVNEVDYEYSQKVEFRVPAVSLPGPIGSPIPSVTGAQPATQTTTQQCLDATNKKLAARRGTFGDTLETWVLTLDATECPDAPLRSAAAGLFPPNSLQGKGTLEIDQNALSAALGNTGPGGSVIITLTAKARKTTAKVQGSNLVVDPPIELPAAEHGAIEKKHSETRTIVIRFGPPRGVRFAIGPYVASLNRKEFVRVSNPDHVADDPMSNELQIGLAEDSDWSYGVAAYWTAPLSANENWGIAWGVGYKAESEAEESIAGLVGGYWRPNKSSPALITFGAALGRTQELEDGRMLGDPIGADEEIAITRELEIRFFAGIGFQF